MSIFALGKKKQAMHCFQLTDEEWGKLVECGKAISTGGQYAAEGYWSTVREILGTRRFVFDPQKNYTANSDCLTHTLRIEEKPL